MIVTLQGKECSVKGSMPELGAKAPSFELVGPDLQMVTLASLGKKRKLLSIFPSLDTAVCAKAAKTFQRQLQEWEDLALLHISMDLPFASTRFCKVEELPLAQTLSAFRSSFPDDYGVRLIDGPLQGLCARAVLLLGADNTVLYRELVSEIADEPDYDAVLSVLRDQVRSS